MGIVRTFQRKKRMNPGSLHLTSPTRQTANFLDKPRASGIQSIDEGRHQTRMAHITISIFLATSGCWTY